jgi:hypothetical protein
MKSDINFISQFFYQTELKPISKRQFETSEVMRILNIRHVILKSSDSFHNEFCSELDFHIYYLFVRN